MHIGIKLGMGYDRKEPYLNLYGDRDVPAYLKGIGVSAAETPVFPETDFHDLKAHIRTICGAGLRISFHPYTEKTPYNLAFFEAEGENSPRDFHRKIFETADYAADLQGMPAVINIHPAAGDAELGRENLLARSVSFFRWAKEWCAAHAPGVRPVAELQIAPKPDEETVRIGDDPAELLEIVQESGVHACWDFGHGFLNHRRRGFSPKLPEALLERVIHVHCHDVDQEDHEPLIFGTVPWRAYLRSLMEKGFDGTVILEVLARQFNKRGGLDPLEKSVAAIQAALKPEPT